MPGPVVVVYGHSEAFEGFHSVCHIGRLNNRSEIEPRLLFACEISLLTQVHLTLDVREFLFSLNKHDMCGTWVFTISHKVLL